jgi:hypothetical protein
MRLPLDLHPKYWRQLRKELREMSNKSVLLDMVCTSLDETDLSNEPVGPTTRHGAKQLKELLPQVHSFLKKNRLEPSHIPTIEQLGKYEGGYYLVKQISDLGGLKKFRRAYSSYIR